MVGSGKKEEAEVMRTEAAVTGSNWERGANRGEVAISQRIATAKEGAWGKDSSTPGDAEETMS